MYVPSGIEKPPLLLSLHGRGIPAGWNQGEMMKFEPIADREKFIVVYPEALNNLNWDLGGTSDIDFVRAIIEQMASAHDIDENRVYASGFSMGGMFSYTLACKIPDVIAAIAPGNGYPLGGQSGCVTTRSVPIFHMHGTADDFVPYAGIDDFLATKIAQYGCPTTPTRIDPYPANNPSSRSFLERWGPCSNAESDSGEVTLVHVAGMIHDWATAGKPNANEDPEYAGDPFDIDGSEEAWAFLKQHSLLGPTTGTGGSGNAGTGGVGDGAAGAPPTSGAGGASGATGGTASGDAATGGALPTDLDPTAGCSCRMEATAGPTSGAFFGLGLAVAAFLRRRRSAGA